MHGANVLQQVVTNILFVNICTNICTMLPKLDSFLQIFAVHPLRDGVRFIA